MNVIRPVTVTDAILTSCTVLEPSTGETAWNAATSYAVGAQAIRTTTHRIYECLIAGVNATLPENATTGTTPRWFDVGPTNKWAMLDANVSTQTKATTSMTYVFNPVTSVTGIGFFKMKGSNVRIQVSYSGSSVIDETYSLDGTIVDSSWSWFFEPFAQKETLVMVTIPPYYRPTMTITISGSSGAEVGCGMCSFGSVKPLGSARYGTGFGIADYSGITTDAFGDTSFVRRGNSRILKLDLIFKTSELESFDKTIRELTATPCVWQATEVDDYQFLSTFGFFPNMDTSIPTHGQGTCALEIREVI